MNKSKVTRFFKFKNHQNLPETVSYEKLNHIFKFLNIPYFCHSRRQADGIRPRGLVSKISMGWYSASWGLIFLSIHEGGWMGRGHGPRGARGARAPLKIGNSLVNFFGKRQNLIFIFIRAPLRKKLFLGPWQYESGSRRHDAI